MEPAAQHKSCLTPGCAGRHHAKGLCSACYRRGSASLKARRNAQARLSYAVDSKYRELKLASNKEQYQIHKHARKQSNQAWATRNPERVRTYKQRNQQRSIEIIDDTYVKRLMNLWDNPDPRLIAVGRKIIQLHRMNRERQKGK